MKKLLLMAALFCFAAAPAAMAQTYETPQQVQQQQAQLAKDAEVAKKQAEAALNAFTDTITEALKAGDKVQLMGFGTFEVKERAARTGRKPSTGETIEIPAKKSPSFKAGKGFKDQF